MDGLDAHVCDRMVNKCLLKVAHFAAQLEQYDKAIENLETVATASADNQLTKWSIKEYFLKAGLCHLCTGVSNYTLIIPSLSCNLTMQQHHHP